MGHETGFYICFDFLFRALYGHIIYYYKVFHRARHDNCPLSRSFHCWPGSPAGKPGYLSQYQEDAPPDFILIIIAGFFLALHFAFWISSLNYTSIPSSVLFTNLQVIFVLLFSIFILREKMKQQVIAGIIVAVLGSSLIAGGDLGSGRIYGDMLALLSGFFVAVYFIIGRYVRVRVDVWPYTSMVALVAVLVLLPASALAGLPLLSYPPREWILFFLLALGPGLAGHGILNWALKYVKAPIVAVSILGESVGASILAFLVFGELLLWYQMIGGVLILLGIYVAAVNEARSGEQLLKRKTEDGRRKTEGGECW